MPELKKKYALFIDAINNSTEIKEIIEQAKQNIEQSQLNP